MSLLRLVTGDLGRRVVVRWRLPDGRATDVLGELVRLDAAGLAVRRADGGLVTVAGPDVVAARVVPPAPLRRARGGSVADALALEEVAARGWPPLHQERLGRWLLRASEGFTDRGNSTLLLGLPDRPLAEAVDAVERWYAGWSLPARAAVPTTADGEPLAPVAGVDAELAGRGWRLVTPSVVMTAPLATASPKTTASTSAPLPPGLRLDLAGDPDAAWCAAQGRPLPAAALAVLTGAPVRVFASVRGSSTGGGARERVLAVARGTVDEGWLAVTAVEVSAPARRRGLARALLAALAAWGAGQGADRALLQVASDNAPSRALYESRGFSVHHGYHYRVRP